MRHFYFVSLILCGLCGVAFLSYANGQDTLLVEQTTDAAAELPVINIWSAPVEALPSVANSERLYTAGEISAMAAPTVPLNAGNLDTAEVIISEMDETLLDAVFVSPATLSNIGKTSPKKTVNTNPTADDWRAQLLGETPETVADHDGEPAFFGEEEEGAELELDDDSDDADYQTTAEPVLTPAVNDYKPSGNSRSTISTSTVIENEAVRRQAREIEAAHNLEQGISLFNVGQYAAALVAFDRALAVMPDLKEAQEYRIRARQLAGQPDGNDDDAVVRDIVRVTEARLKERELRLNSGLERASEMYLRTISPGVDRQEMKRGEQIELGLMDLEEAEQSLQAVQLLLKGSGLPAQMEQTLVLRARALSVQIAQERQKLVAEREMRDRDSAMQQVKQDRANVSAQQEQEIRSILTAAEYHVDRKEYDIAMELVEKSIALDPRSSAAYALRDRIRVLNHQETNAEIAQDLKDSVEGWSLDVQEAYILDAKKMVTYPLDWERIRERAKKIRISSSIDDEARKVIGRFANITGDFDYFEQPLMVAMRDFEQRARVTISLASSVDGETTVRTARLSGVTLKAAFDQIVEDLGLEYKYEDEAVMIRKKGSAKGVPVMQVYPIADIISRPRPFRVNRGMVAGMGKKSDESDTNLIFGENVNETTDDAEWREPDFKIDSVLKTSIGGEGAWEMPNGIMVWEDNLLVFNTPEIQTAVANFLDEWRSSARQQVFVEGRFLDINDSFGEAFGIDWGQAMNGNFAGGSYTAGSSFYGARNGIIANGTNGSGITSGNITTPATVVGGLLANLQLNSLRLNLTLTAAQKTQKGTVLHNPKLLVGNGKSAFCQLLNQRSYIKDYQTGSSGNSNAITVTTAYLLTGVTWEVRPVISFDRKYITVRVRPEMVQELNSLMVPDESGSPRDIVANRKNSLDLNVTIESTNSTSGGSGGATTASTSQWKIQLEAPIRRATQFWTNAVVPDGGTVLVGGQLFDKNSESVIGVPVLSSIPVIGRLARTDSKSRETINRVIMLSAKIVDLED